MCWVHSVDGFAPLADVMTQQALDDATDRVVREAPIERLDERRRGQVRDTIVREIPVTPEETRRQDREYTWRIARQVRRLSHEHPEHRDAFERYLALERRESALLEDHMACATWMLRRH